ncbi:30S ribosome-binding factor RbfA [Azospirillum doebereinerae]
MANKKRGAINAGKPPSQRQLRVGEELRHTLADLFRRGDFYDPELSALNLTVTEVRISPDLSNATVFFSTLGGGQMEEAKAILRRASPFLRGQVARMVNLRHAPTLSFEIDTSFEYAHHIDNILHSPEVARDLGRVNGDDDHDEDEDDSWDEDDDAADTGDDADDGDEEAGDDDGQDKGGRRGS